MLFALFRPVLHILLLVALPSVLLFLVFVCRLVTVVAATIFGRVVFAWALFSVVFGCLSELFGQRQLLHFVAQEFFDLLEIVGIVFRNEGDGRPRAGSTSRTTNAVHIVFGIVGHVVVDDHGDVVDVDAARNHVGSHEHIKLAALEFEHHVVAGGLVEV